MDASCCRTSRLSRGTQERSAEARTSHASDLSYPVLCIPRLTPCAHELAAVLGRIAKEHSINAGGVLFLLDGSGSVFQSMSQITAERKLSVGTGLA